MSGRFGGNRAVPRGVRWWAMRHGPDALLCEGCGYHLRGLTRADACPECGRPILESLHSRRQGTPWQQKPSLVAWIDTMRSMLLAPRRFWDTVQIPDEPSRTSGPNLMLAVVAICIVPGVQFAAMLEMMQISYRRADASFFLIWITITICILILLWVCIRTEEIGCRVISRVHGWRVPRGAIRAIVDHATVGWAVGAILLIALTSTLLIVPRRSDDIYLGIVMQLMLYTFLASVAIGLIVFETLVYLGLRSMKYANTAWSERELDDATAGGDGDAG